MEDVAYLGGVEGRGDKHYVKSLRVQVMQFQGLILGASFVFRVILSSGFWDACCFREILEGRVFVDLCFPVLCVLVYLLSQN
jgi:hypothetical protein